MIIFAESIEMKFLYEIKELIIIGPFRLLFHHQIIVFVVAQVPVVLVAILQSIDYLVIAYVD